MAVALADLVPALKLEVNPPGADLFPTTTDTEWEERLRTGFWNARLDDLLTEYFVNDDYEIVPVSGTTDIPPELQQLVIFYTAFQVLFSRLMETQTVFRAQAGPVSYETQRSAQTLRELLLLLKERKAQLIDKLITSGYAADYVFDSVCAREEAILSRTGWFVI